MKNTPSKTPKKRGNPQFLKPPWKKGESGNPNGRPTHVKILSDEITRQMLLPADFKNASGKPIFKDKRTYEVYVGALIKLAMKGNATAIKEINERLEGKVEQALVGRNGGPIQIENKNKWDEMTDDELRNAAIEAGYVEK